MQYITFDVSDIEALQDTLNYYADEYDVIHIKTFFDGNCIITRVVMEWIYYTRVSDAIHARKKQ